jgi:protein-S-isoprenylcysteine O-methyltransferase
MPLTTWLAIVGVLLWLGYEVVLRRRTGPETDREDADRGSTVVLITAYGVAVVLTVTLSLAGTGRVPVGLRWVGVAAIAVGLVVRAWGMAVLGRFYTRTLRVTGDQHVVTSGPYRLIRHPGYLGSLLVWLGYCLGVGNWIALLAVAALMTGAYAWRIHAEERMLAETLGDEYRAYQRRTARLVPFVY